MFSGDSNRGLSSDFARASSPGIGEEPCDGGCFSAHGDVERGLSSGFEFPADSVDLRPLREQEGHEVGVAAPHGVVQGSCPQVLLFQIGAVFEKKTRCFDTAPADGRVPHHREVVRSPLIDTLRILVEQATRPLEIIHGERRRKRVRRASIQEESDDFLLARVGTRLDRGFVRRGDRMGEFRESVGRGSCRVGVEVGGTDRAVDESGVVSGEIVLHEGTAVGGVREARRPMIPPDALMLIENERRVRVASGSGDVGRRASLVVHRVRITTGAGVEAWAYAYGDGLELTLSPSGDWFDRPVR